MIQLLEKIKNIGISLSLSLETFVKISLLSKKSTIPKAKEQAIWILANGPSLNNDLGLFYGTAVTVGVVNNFANYESYEKVRPAIYFLQAPEFWIDDLLPSYIKSRKLLFSNIAEKTTWPLTLFVPIKAKKYKKNFPSLINHSFIKLVYYNDTPVEGIQSINHFFFNSQLGMPRPHNILIPSIMLSINMGFKELYLLGVDHSWLPEISVDQQNNALISQKHFYDAKDAASETMKKMGKGQRHLHEILHKFYLTFKGYFTIKEYADQKGVSIYNCTKNSFIDAFKKVELSAVFPTPSERKM